MAIHEDSSLRAGADPVTELEELREDLRLCRRELEQVRRQNEQVLERQARLRRAKNRAQRESVILSQALVDVLYRETLLRVKARWWQPTRDPVSKLEWQQIQTLRQSGIFRPAWYLRRNLTVAKLAIDPALHFLRDGSREGRDPGPDFDLLAYLEEHPEVRKEGINPVLHAVETGEVPERPTKSSTT
jgi:hypothetical protein